MSKNNVNIDPWVIRVLIKDSQGNKETKYWFGPNRNKGKALGRLEQAKRFSSRSEARNEASKVLPDVLPPGSSSTAIRFSEVEESSVKEEYSEELVTASRIIMRAYSESAADSLPEETVYIRLARKLLEYGVKF